MNLYPQDGDICALDVLVSDTDVGAERRKERNSRREPSPSRKLKDPLADEQPLNKTSQLQGRVQRVRIHSVPINMLLRLATGQRDHTRWDNDTKTFSRPFRCFIRVQSKMQEELGKMKEYLRHQAVKCEGNIASTPANDTKRLPLDIYERDLNIAYIAELPDAVDQIQCFIKFVEDRIIPDFQSYSEFHKRPSHQVHYEDLWYIFRPGDLLYTPNHNAVHSRSRDAVTTQTIWRIFDVSLPGPYKEALAPRDDTSSEVGGIRYDFNVQCYYIDYDGTEFCPINSSFQLERYDGGREVTSLTFYPLRFAPNSAQILEQAQSTGSNFVSNVISPGRYGYYSGWTLIHNPLGEPVQDAGGESMRAEHVDSDIIVDTRKYLPFQLLSYFICI